MRLATVRVGRFRVCALAADSGRCDTEEFFERLRRDRRADYHGLLDLILRAAEQGRPASKQHCHDLGDGIWEFVQGVARLFWFYDDEDGSLIICTHGLWKKTQKTPKAEIERAANRRRQYRDSKRAGTLSRDWEEKGR